MEPFGDNRGDNQPLQAEKDNEHNSTSQVSTQSKPLTKSRVFDAVSVARALLEFMSCTTAKFSGKQLVLDGTSTDQEAFAHYLRDHQAEIMAATGLTSLASENCAVLNGFLAGNGSGRTLDPFDGIGVVTIYRMLARWINKAKLGSIEYQGKSYTGFTVNPANMLIWQLEHNDGSEYTRVALELLTRTGHRLFISELPPDLVPPTGPMDLVRTVDRLHHAPRHIARRYTAGATLPMIRFSTSTGLNWLNGLIVQLPTDRPSIACATQDWEVDINEAGAETDTVTTLAPELTSTTGSGEPLTIKQPVFVWIVAPGSDIPQGTMFSHPEDTWIPAN